MNSFERVMSTLQGLPVDRVPVLAVLNVLSTKLTNLPMKKIYTDLDAYVDSQKAIIDTFGIDMVLSTFDYSVIGEAYGSKVAWFDNQAPNIKKPLTISFEEFLSQPLPDIRNTGRLPLAIAASRKLAETYQGKIPIFAAVPGVCSLPALIFGLERWLDTLLFDPQTAHKILLHTGKFFVDWCNALLKAGNTALIITEGVTAKEVIYRDLFTSRFLPVIQELFPQIEGPIVFHHTGGSINHILDLLPAIPGLIAVAVGSKDNLSEARKLVGNQMSIIGNLDNLSFPAASEEGIYSRSMQKLEEMSAPGHYFLANSGADIPLNTPLENIHALLRASKDFAAKTV